jgi:hypothetical protein
MASNTPRFSNVGKSNKPKAKFKKHNVYEVATSLTEAKYIASDIADTDRYAYRARAYVVGNSNLRPYDPVYIDGVPNNLSGYWTVLSIRHIFGGTEAPYMMELELGCDLLGDVNPNAASASETRNVNNELAGKDLSSSSSALTSYAVAPNQNSIPVPKLTASPKVVKPVSFVPGSTNPYSHDSTIPNYQVAPRTTSWVATKGSKII